jgi:hypothetical protein
MTTENPRLLEGYRIVVQELLKTASEEQLWKVLLEISQGQLKQLADQAKSKRKRNPDGTLTSNVVSLNS